MKKTIPLYLSLMLAFPQAAQAETVKDYDDFSDGRMYHCLQEIYDQGIKTGLLPQDTPAFLDGIIWRFSPEYIVKIHEEYMKCLREGVEIDLSPLGLHA